MFLYDVTVNPLKDGSGVVVVVTCVLIHITDIRGVAGYEEVRNEGM
jgi:hypothetical protein